VALYLRVLQAARDALAAWNGRFAAARASGDAAQALRLAHDLKSTGATLGATGLAAAAERLEAALRSGAAADASMLADIEAQLQPLQSVLRDM
jgi:HPt (histidine-containing phosphotransfer) domain-containing protein